MLQVINKTPFEAALVPGTDKHGLDFATLVVKGTFELAASGEGLHLAELQVPLYFADEFNGAPDDSSPKYESDVGPAKNGTDVVLVGHAYAPRGRTGQLDVTLEAGPVRKTIRVFGERHWRRGVTGRRASAPEPFERMPLVYERAFGGSDTSHPDEKKHATEWRNPVGRGFTTQGRRDHLEGPLPNLEDPGELIRGPKTKPRPAAFGYIGRGWEPRKNHAGTYDAAWQQERCPLLPLDFDERYFRSAHPDLASATHFGGGEAVRVVNASAEGLIRFGVPRVELDVRSRLRMKEEQHATVLDTLLIEPDQRRVQLVWKATIPCPRLVLYLSWVRVKLNARGWEG